MPSRKSIVQRSLGVLVIVSLTCVIGYHSINKTCCSDVLSDNQLRGLLTSAESGDVAAMKQLVVYFEDREDLHNAKRWLTSAADRGDPAAALHLYDVLVASDNATAMKYLLKAAEGGSATAQEVLGRSYRDGSGVSKDMGKADFWLRKSAVSGNHGGILALCELALASGNRRQCEECLDLDERGLASLDPRSSMAKELSNQRERIGRKLKEW